MTTPTLASVPQTPRDLAKELIRDYVEAGYSYSLLRSMQMGWSWSNCRADLHGDDLIIWRMRPQLPAEPFYPEKPLARFKLRAIYNEVKSEATSFQPTLWEMEATS